MSIIESETQNISSFFDSVLSKITDEDAADIRRMMKNFNQQVNRMKKKLSDVLALKTEDTSALNHEYTVENTTHKEEENEEKKKKDAYYRRTVQVSRFETVDKSSSAVKRCLNNLKQANLKFMFDSCEKFFIDKNNNIRLTYSSRRQAIQMLLEAKRVLRNLSPCQVNIECLIPPDKIDMMIKLKKRAMDMKKEGLFENFNIFETKWMGEWVMKLRVRGPMGFKVLWASYVLDDQNYFNIREIFNNSLYYN